MQFIPTEFPGLFIVEPRVFQDSRGFFLESHSQAKFAAAGLSYDFIQDNHAFSTVPGVLRGLHLQLPPAAQAKLVRVARGSVLDVVLDLRKGSPTFGRTYALELSDQNFRMLMIPRGFAHAYLTLTPDTDFLYKVDAPYAPETEAGIIWNDPDLGLSWPVSDPVLSPKDRVLPRLKDFDSPFVFEG